MMSAPGAKNVMNGPGAAPMLTIVQISGNCKAFWAERILSGIQSHSPLSKLRIKIYQEWQEHFSQSAQRSQRMSKALALCIAKVSPAFLGVLCELCERRLSILHFSAALSGLGGTAFSSKLTVRSAECDNVVGGRAKYK